MKLDVIKTNELTGHQDAIYALYHEPNTSKFYSSGGDGLVVEWDFDTFPDGKLIAKVPNSVYSIYVSQNNLYVGHNYDGIHLLDSLTRQELKSVHLGKEATFSITRFNNQIIVGLANGELIALQVDNLSILKRFKLGNDRIRKLFAYKDILFAACSDENIYQLDKEINIIKSWKAHEKSVTGLTVHKETLISIGRDARIKFWSLNEDLNLEHQIPAHNYAINDICISPDEKYFATCSIDKTIKIWSTETRRLLKVVDKQRHAGHGTSVNKIFWKSNDCFVSCSDDRTISVWKIKEQQ